MATRLPAKDLNRARAFYSEKLGLDPVEQRDGGLRYVCAAGEFAIFVSVGVQSGTHTQMGWEVDDIEATVRELRARGGDGHGVADVRKWPKAADLGVAASRQLI